MFYVIVSGIVFLIYLSDSLLVYVGFYPKTLLDLFISYNSFSFVGVEAFINHVGRMTCLFCAYQEASLPGYSSHFPVDL